MKKGCQSPQGISLVSLVQSDWLFIISKRLSISYYLQLLRARDGVVVYVFATKLMAVHYSQWIVTPLQNFFVSSPHRRDIRERHLGLLFAATHVDAPGCLQANWTSFFFLWKEATQQNVSYSCVSEPNCGKVTVTLPLCTFPNNHQFQTNFSDPNARYSISHLYYWVFNQFLPYTVPKFLRLYVGVSEIHAVKLYDTKIGALMKPDLNPLVFMKSICICLKLCDLPKLTIPKDLINSWSI